MPFGSGAVGLRTLIVDPDVDRLKETQGFLEMLDHRVVALAADGVWAVSMARKHKADLAVLDSGLPELATSKVIQVIRREQLAKYIIVGYSLLKAELIRIDGDVRTMGIRRPFTPINLQAAITLMLEAEKPKVEASAAPPRDDLPPWVLTNIQELPKKL